MVICCPGHIGNEAHCDRLKGSNDISFSPLDPNFIATLSYRTDGTIISSNAQFNKEINEVLNLNTPLLKTNRKECWEAVKNQIVSKQRKQPWNRAILLKYIEKYCVMHEEDGKLKHIPYCGIVKFKLQKKLSQL